MEFVGPQKSRRPWWQRILKRLIVGLVVLVGVTGFQIWRAHDNAAKQLDKYAIGDCLVLTKKGLGVEDAATECGKEPSYTVASRLDGGGTCPNDNYAAFEVTTGGDSAGRLCLIENFVPGHCYRSDMISKVSELVDCSQGSMLTATVRVLSRQDIGNAACEGNQIAISYPEPAPGRTYCTAPS